MYYLIEISPTDVHQCQCHRIDASKVIVDSQSMALTELPEHVQDVPVAILLPANKVTTFDVALPKMPLNELKQALPFAVEDFIADDLDDVLIMRGVHANDIQTVAVIAKAYFDRLYQALKKLGLSVISIQPQFTRYMMAENHWVLCVNDDEYVWRKSRQHGAAIGNEGFQDVFAAMWQRNKDNPPQQLQVYGELDAAHADYLNSLALPVNVQSQACPLDIVSLFEKPAFNFLQQGYRLKARMTPLQRRWCWAVLSVIMAICMVFAANLATWLYAKHELSTAKQQQTTLLQDLGMSSASLDDIKSTMDDSIKQLQTQDKNNGFLAILNDIAVPLHKHQEWHILKISYANNQMIVIVQAAPNTSLGPVLTTIRKTGYVVTTKRTSKVADILRYQLTIKRTVTS